MSELLSGLMDEAGASQLEGAVELRRRLHEHPELGNELPQTQATVLEALDGLPLEITTGDGLSSIVAVLDGDEPGPTILMRGDMDALPMPEDTGRSEEHTSELQSLMRISYAVFCLKKKTQHT